jgi:hypothetical protein
MARVSSAILRGMTIRIRKTGVTYGGAGWLGHSWVRVRVYGGWLHFRADEFDVLGEAHGPSITVP